MARSNRNQSSFFNSFFILILIIVSVGLFGYFKKIPLWSSSSEMALKQNGLSKEEINLMIRDYIKENPEVVISAVEEFQVRKMREMEEKSKEIIQNKKREIHSDNSSPMSGNTSGDVNIIEFFDYRCGHCKRANATVEQLLAEDKNIKVIYKELPILGEDSKKAAQAALAVYNIDPAKFLPFHNGLMAAEQLDDKLIENLAASLNIDIHLLKSWINNPSVNDELNRVRELAGQIGIHGTPAFIIGDELIPGAIDIASLKKKIAAVRANKKSK